MKKYILFMFCCFMLFLMNVKGEVYNGEFYAGEKIDNVYIVKIDSSGNTKYKQGNFIIDSLTGGYVYCLEPFVSIDNTKDYDIVTSDFVDALGISDDVWEFINLLAYYGYGYGDHTDDYWYYVTQVLIWRAMEPQSQVFFTNGLYGEINEDLYSAQITEILNLVNAHHVTPSFNLTDMYINDTYYLNDLNGILSNYSVTSNNAYIDGNNLVVTPLSDEMTVSFIRNDTGVSKLFVSGDSQNVLYGSSPVSVTSEVVINARLKTGSITILKYGEVFDNLSYTYEAMEGACFTLFDESGNELSIKCSDNTGTVLFSDIPLGTYYVEESSTLDNYQIDTTRYKVTLTVDSNNSVINQVLEVYNDLYKGSISITKTGSECNNYLEGVVYALYDEDMNLIVSDTTDEYGFLQFTLPIGTYYLKEISTLDGYILNDEVIDVSIKVGSSGYPINIALNLTNEEYKGSITITKIGDSDELLEGVEYALYDEDMSLLETLKTTSSGIITFDDLSLGTYYLQEVGTLDEYRLNDEIIEVVITEEQLDIELKLYNELKTTSIVIKKVDSDTLDVLSNAIFNLYDSEYNLIYEGTTDENGIINIDNIKLGSYILEETSAPDGYELIDYSYEFSLDNDNSKITITVKNKKQIIIEIPDTNVESIYNIILFYKEKYKFI